MHPQTINFQVARLILERLVDATQPLGGKTQRVLRYRSRHQLFPQVYGFVNEYVECKVDFQDAHPCELGLQKYVERMVACYARNDHLGLVIPYEYQGVDHCYEPDFLVRLTGGMTVVLEIKGFTDDQTRAKHSAARRWVEAVNNWGELGRWAFHVCANPLLLDAQLSRLARGEVANESADADQDRLVLRG